MRPRVAAVTLAALIAAMMPGRTSAWGFDVHRFIADKAIDLLPDGLRPFYQKHRAFIVEHAVDPDLWRTAGWLEEPPRHFLDLDAYGPPPFAALPREYDRAVERWGREFVEKNGLLPWRTAEVYGQLRRAFEQQRKGGGGYSLENVKFFSAVIAHYVADGHVPFHAVLNYDGQLSGQQGIHSRWETELVLRDLPTLKLSPAPPKPVADARTFMFEVLETSFPGAEVILKADALAASGRDAYDDEYFSILDRETRPLLEKQLSSAISDVASVIYGAWDAAGRPELELDAPREVRKIKR
jgi:Zinc dependent phospholipase C